MAKYVLLEFDNNDEADNFAAMMQVPMPADGPGGASMRVRGVYQKPTQFCECPNPGEKSVRGRKHGWWVHKECGRPRKGVWQSGNNQLFPDERVGERKMLISLVEPQPEKPASA